MKLTRQKIAVVIPCFRVSVHILGLINKIGNEVDHIYVVDDACPDSTGTLVIENCTDKRVKVIFHSINTGVGGAVITGYEHAIKDNVDIVVKIDGDGQMDPSLINNFISPILLGDCDYTKGNRFFELENLRSMPRIRIFGNSVLSFLTKFSSGYWDIFDPTNGYTAIHCSIISLLPVHKINKRFFFESDMLFRLNLIKAVVVDVPMVAKYENEKSNLKITKIAIPFFILHCKNISKRIFYNYYLRDLSLASFELPFGISLMVFAIFFGSYNWVHSSLNNESTPNGTLTIIALSFLTGLQLILAFVGHDIASIPKRVRHKFLVSFKR